MISVKYSEVSKKETLFDNRNDIFLNGSNNAYPEKIDRLLNNSVTAKMSSAIMTQYLLGKGFGEENDKSIINKDGTTLKQFSYRLAKELVEQRGVFIHVNYEAEANGFKIVNPKVLHFDWCRIGRSDDLGYSGKIHVKKDWRNSKEKAVEFDVFNNDANVLNVQIEKADGIANYKGQIFYYNSDTKYHYPLARIDSVMSDCDSEAQASVYKNQLLRKGFFGKTLVVTRPLVDDTINETVINEDGEEVPNREYLDEVSEAEQLTDDLTDFMGAENVGGAMVVSLDHAGEKLEDAIIIKNIEANIEPDLFREVEASVRDNILIAHNNLPVGLIKGNDGLFSVGGEAIKEMKKTYWQNTTIERDLFLVILNKFTVNIFDTRLDVVTLIEENEPIKEEEND